MGVSDLNKVDADRPRCPIALVDLAYSFPNIQGILGLDRNLPRCIWTICLP
jgi:hypothetical protein